MSKNTPPAQLFVVATPIGNLRDITLRGLDVLKSVCHVAAEDTRKTRKLLAAYDIKTHLVSLHAHSTDERLQWLISKLLDGEDVAYVTDAGTPAVSDPGTRLVDLAHRAGVDVRAIPGPSALPAAISVSGLPSGEILFVGFLPRPKGKRRSELRRILSTKATSVLYESPARIRKLLGEIDLLDPSRTVVICRELTKLHEEVLRGTPHELAELLAAEPKGEFTVVIEPGRQQRAAPSRDELLQRIRALREEGRSASQVAKQVAVETSISRKEAYQLVIDDEESPLAEKVRHPSSK